MVVHQYGPPLPCVCVEFFLHAFAAYEQVKKGAAETEPAWKGAGAKVGIQIWRIVKFKVSCSLVFIVQLLRSLSSMLLVGKPCIGHPLAEG